MGMCVLKSVAVVGWEQRHTCHPTVVERPARGTNKEAHSNHLRAEATVSELEFDARRRPP